jgi:lipopolysaccharide transport system ATP-binding protein
MRKSEIDARFDEIVAFADLARFLDTPVKRYSSGMYVRLAFAIGAHLDPEVLIVDEVLAVGDLAFQRKCLGKMGEVSRQGRTVLFVSHNMAAVEHLCRSGLVLQHGEVAFRGTARDAVDHYVRSAAVNPHDPGSHVVDLAAAPHRLSVERRLLRTLEFSRPVAVRCAGRCPWVRPSRRGSASCSIVLPSGST